MRFLFMFFVLTLAGCSPVRVVYDYDKTEDYTRFKTYAFFSPMETRLGELDTRRALRAIDQVLQAKGFEKTEEGGTPDFYVNVKSEMFQEMPSGSVGIGMGGAGNNMGGAVSVGVPVGSPTVKRMIFLDLVDVKQDALIWQARCEVTYEQSIKAAKRDEKMVKVMEKAFREFPPSKKN